jgi:hypothetical protein
MEAQAPDWKTTVAYGVGWFVSSVLLIIDLLYLRELLITIMTYVYGRINAARTARGQLTDTSLSFTIDAIDRGMIFLGGIVAVSLAILIEYYYRKGEYKGDLFSRILKVVGTEIGIIVLSLVLQLVI